MRLSNAIVVSWTRQNRFVRSELVGKALRKVGES